MRRIVVNEWMSLDGVVQAPGAPDEDRSGGFEHGGWHLHVLGGGKRIFPDDGALRSLRLVDSEVVSTGAMLLTYTPVSDAEQR